MSRREQMSAMRRSRTDILILGSGGAGLFAAWHAARAAPELKVTIAVKGLLGKCGCTRMVQGGYNVALAPGDSVERHFMDTIEGGKWLPDQDLAWTLVEKAVERVRELANELGCFFDRNHDGRLHQKAFAGQTFDRTVHKGDLTGIEIINRLAEQVWVAGVDRLEEHRAIELAKSSDGALAGAVMIDMREGEFLFVQAKSVLLATGGGPPMYRYHTPSGDKSCDGLAMALRAGLTLRELEMGQFHPTGLLAGPGTRMTGTVVGGLFAAGEDTGGVHGANRLGGNGVANSTVFGAIAGDAMARWTALHGEWRTPAGGGLDDAEARARHPTTKPAGDIEAIREALHQVMWDDVGILRDAQGLQRAQRRLRELRADLSEAGVAGADLRYNLTWHDWLNLESLITVSEAICAAALARDDSRGAHFPEDFPHTGELATSAYSRVRPTPRTDAPHVSRKPVRFTRVQPGQSLLTS